MNHWSGLLKRPKVVIGMIHVPALPGAPQFKSNMMDIESQILRDAEALQKGGVHAVMMENFGDIPFTAARVEAHTVAAMTRLACAVRSQLDLPLGINILRNDGLSALAIAMASNADFIRVNVLCGARVTDQGLIQGIAYELLRARSSLAAGHIAIMADVDVKHSAPLSERPIGDEVEDTIKRGLADAVIVSGSGTGKRADLDKVKSVQNAAGKTPTFLGSGVGVDSLDDYWSSAKGFIVGTAFKKNSLVHEPVDVKRVKEFMSKVQNHRKS